MPGSEFLVVENMLGIQLDFNQLEAGELFHSSDDCSVYGDDITAILLCIAQGADDNTVIASTRPSLTVN